MDIFELYAGVINITTDPSRTSWLCPLLLASDAALSALIVWKIPYTEIDFSTYMQQVSLFRSGEHDYTKLTGSTGPLVYPAGHVYLYSALHEMTAGGERVLLAQGIFVALYLLGLAVVMAVYRGVKAPPYLFPLLILSKRMHSIFMLRLFNDCFAIILLFVAILAYQKRQWTLGSLAFSLGLSVKMVLLVALPGVGMVVGQARPVGSALKNVALMAQVQALLAFPFLAENPLGYLSRAFDFSRQFLFKWTVNWRFVGEDTFLSAPFSQALATATLSILAIFGLTRWTKPSGMPFGALLQRFYQATAENAERQMSRRVTPDFVTSTVLASLAIGLLCARSLHYQFFAYIAWTSPYLLWKAGLHPIPIYAIWAAQEWAWNVYPSTETSSQVVIGCLAVQVVGIWWGTRDDFAYIKARSQLLEDHQHVN